MQCTTEFWPIVARFDGLADHAREGHVRILMGTHNGEAYLPDQLESFAAQTWPNWSLLVSDDGSRDGTRALVADFATRHPERLIELHDGPGNGAADNFLSLLHRSVRANPEAMVAFSDQDDVWLPVKLERAARWLARHGAREGRALAWVCRTVLTDEHLKPIGESRYHVRPPDFGNALVQNILAGNTIVLSPAAAELMAFSNTHGGSTKS